MTMTDMTVRDSSAGVRFVLVRTSHPGNIGGAARAMRTMGLRELALVTPQRFPDPEADALAVGARDMLEVAQVHEALPDALHGCHLVMGLSARRRGVTLPEYTPRDAAAQVRQAQAQGQRVALLFGNESSGLANEELAHCHAMVRIPSVEDFSSLNLAQAVQVMAYELRMASLDAVELSPPGPRELPADAAQMEQFFTHLEQTLEDIDFHKGRAAHTILLRLRKLFLRARPEQRELRILHGILADAQRVGRIAADPSCDRDP